MPNVAIFFDNGIDQIPFVLAEQNGVTRIHRNFSRLKLLPDTITLGYHDIIDSLRRLDAPPPNAQQRIETLYALTIGYSKGDAPKRWQFRKQDIIGNRLDQKLLSSLSQFDNAKIGWDKFSSILFEAKQTLIQSVVESYNEMASAYIGTNETRRAWLAIEHKVDSYFLRIQYDGIAVNNAKIEKLIKELNFEKYASLLYLDQYHGIDISSGFLSDEYINGLVLTKVSSTEQTEELSDLVQVLDESDKRIEAIRKVRECRIDFSNLIKHYTVGESQFVFPHYETVASSSGRIFISSPGTQYLKKAKRDIFFPRPGYRLSYFDFRNYEPGIAAGLSADASFLSYYNSGDMYLKIANEEYGAPEFRKFVKIAVLSSLYGMSESSLQRHFQDTPGFDPEKVTRVLQSFRRFQDWKKGTTDLAIANEQTQQVNYTRKFLRERLWKANTSAVNHVVQSTGSAILKTCILRVAMIPGIRILIPMHDALLCECSLEDYSTNEALVVGAMEEVFSEFIQGVSAKVVVSDFSE